MDDSDILFREAETRIEGLACRAQSVDPRDRFDEAALDLVRIAESTGLRAEVAALAGLPVTATDEILARAIVNGGPAFFWDEEWPSLKARLIEGWARGVEACERVPE